MLGKAKYFLTLYLKSGYWQIPLNEEDKEKTTLPVVVVFTNTMACLLAGPMSLEYSGNSCQ